MKDNFILLINKVNKYFAEDKLKHIVVSSIIMACLGLFMPKLVAAIITICIGLGKELYDKYSGKGFFDIHDLVCNAIGIIIGVF